MIERLSALRPLWVPGGILAAAALILWIGRPLPPSLSGLHSTGPYAALIAAVALAWWFNRGRAFVIAASLLGGFAAWQYFHSKAVYTALVMLVPFNAFLVMLYAERGARYRAAYGWLLLLAAEAVLVWWIGSSRQHWWFDNWWLRSPPTPFVGRLICAAAFAVAVWRAWPEFKPIPVGNAGAIATFFLAAEWAGSSGAYALFMAASGLVLIIALLQESHQLAFRDQLTGLPGRRALDERLRSVGSRYAVGMVDVDHFKQFNDTHGHDVGDQVLRLVGGRLAEVAGGVAYRYGGEEFCVLFPDSDMAQAERALEAMRASIEHYRMAVRGADRPKQAEEGTKRRGRSSSDGSPEEMLSVTVSIGVAAPSAKHGAPREVVMAADEALYRAKRGGRNRVSR
ncbi:MAG TPA: GGDEF domain-containing protein [Burkholderiales bacterium]